MKELVKYEFRKIWTQLTIVAVVSLIVISTITNLIAFYDSSVAITSDGKEVKGIKSFRTIKNESKNIKGVMNQDYLDNLVKEFNSSKEKQEFKDSLGLDLTTKYNYTNHIINFANYGKDTFNNMMDLDFDFLKSEKEFYNQYKKSVSDTIRFHNTNNWFKYTDNHMDMINEKIDKLETPFKVDYYEGLTHFIWQYESQYLLVLIVVGFALSSLFSKDSNNGIDELTLSSKFGRKKNMNARIIAGNMFAVAVYIIFIGTLLIEFGAVVSLQGWGVSIQNLWYTCLYNISAGTGILIMISHGILGVLIVANLVMLISIKVKYSKLATLLSLSSIYILERLTYTSNTLQLQLNPIYFANSFYSATPNAFEIYYFIGNIMIPYTLVFAVIACIYMLIIRCLTVRQYKRYKLN
ncbi:hypothetical protein G9F73_005540 [Clostridium estertheticum]|uniref:hypothetical protein n=1 Tax=Clostridium estertheticum TaxID=238834 RepID=UPI0013EE62B4|nr:hypothetical protein [Clostridium estertheticum]MBZ9607288.1 hypothetical protein [Clostridium estertheticum]